MPFAAFVNAWMGPLSVPLAEPAPRRGSVLGASRSSCVPVENGRKGGDDDSEVMDVAECAYSKSQQHPLLPIGRHNFKF
jgi:hypothetical protein